MSTFWMPAPEDVPAIDAKLWAEIPKNCIPFESRAKYMPWFDRFEIAYTGYALSNIYSWTSAKSLGMKRVMGPRGPRWAEAKFDNFQPIPKRLINTVGGRLERSVGALFSWRVLTTQQFSALTGFESRNARGFLNKMFCYGLVERGTLSRDGAYARPPRLWRLRNGPELKQYLENLPPERRMRLLTDVGTMSSGGHDRHDLIAAEIAIRAAETMPGLQGVLGERLSGARELLPDQPDIMSRGDLTIVRSDGLNIVVEVTTQPGVRQVREKMARWGRLLGERGGVNSTGIAVVFLVANHERTSGTLATLQRNHDKALIPAELGKDGNPAAPNIVKAARASIFVAHMEYWFPSPWFVSNDFVNLQIHYATKPGSWDHETRSLMHDLPFTPTHTQLDYHALQKSRERIYAIPPWIEGPILHVATPEMG